MASNTVPGAQMRPNKTHQAQGRTYPSRPFPKADGAPIQCELCVDRFGFSVHDAPCCPFLQPENIKDREINQRVLQLKFTHSMKQDAVPEKLKEAIKSRTVPQQARLPNPVAQFAEADIPSDEDSDSEQFPSENHEDPEIDTASFDYPLPPC
jgi:hypothetical protein